MALITLPSIPERGVSQQYSINMTELSSLVTDAYFNDQENLQLVNVVYKSAVSNQLMKISFIPTGASSLNANANFFLDARDLFDIQSIVLQDKQNGRYVLYAADIPDVANYEVNFAGPVLNYVNWDLFTSGFTLAAEGFISKAGAVSDFGTCPRSSMPMPGDFELIFEALDTDILNGWCVGASKSLTSPENGANQFVFLSDGGQMKVYTTGSFRVSSVPLVVGTNTFKVSRTNGVISFFINSNPTAVYTEAVSDILYPESRVGGTVRSASYTVAAVNYIDWDLVYNPAVQIEADGGIYVNADGEYWWINKSTLALTSDFILEYTVGANFFETAVGVSSNTTLQPQGSQFSGAWAIFSWNLGEFDWVVNDAVTEINIPGLAGTNKIIFQRIGSNVSVKINGVEVRTFTSSAVLYPLGRAWKAGNPVVSASYVNL